MAYVKILYQDSPSTATPLNAQNLNHMDDGIAENDRRLNELATAGVVNTFNSRTGNVTSEKGDYDINQIVASNGQEGYIPVWRNSGTEQEPDWGFAMEEMGGSGHEILDADGTSMAQEDALQFADAFLTDDSVNGRTVVENIKEVDPADYDSTTDEGIIVTDDGDDALIGAVSDDIEEVTGNGSKTYATLLNELYTKIDKSKLTPYSKIVMISQYGTMQYDVVFYTNSIIVASQSNAAASDLNTDTAILSSASTYYQYRNGSSQDTSSSVLNNGGTITLYYGKKKATVDLQTTANRCWYDSENTVKQKIDSMESLPSSVRAWSGDTLKFSIPQSNGVIYKFIAMNNVGNLVEACFINRTDGVKVAHTSALTMSATYANGELTVTLPSTSYWVYSLTVIKSRY